MANKAAGSQWLKGYFNLNKFTLTHCSFIGNNESLEITSKGNIEQVYGKKYAPANDTALMHVEFSLKYDHLNLDFLKIIFEKIHINDIIEYIESSPSGKYERQIGFFYEFLTGNTLNINKTISGNYIYVLDPNEYFGLKYTTHFGLKYTTRFGLKYTTRFGAKYTTPFGSKYTFLS